MFASSDHYFRWRQLRDNYYDGHKEQTLNMLCELIPQFRETIDDLRLLFYLGFHTDREIYESALSYFQTWKSNPPERFDYRCSTYVYAVRNSIPEEVQRKKPYLIPLFLEATGYALESPIH